MIKWGALGEPLRERLEPPDFGEDDEYDTDDEEDEEDDEDDEDDEEDEEGGLQ